MAEVLANWRTYVPRDDFLTQRGGTFLLEADDSLLYSYRDRGMLGFSATMARPLSFLDPYLGAPSHGSTSLVAAAGRPGLCGRPGALDR